MEGGGDRGTRRWSTRDAPSPRGATEGDGSADGYRPDGSEAVLLLFPSHCQEQAFLLELKVPHAEAEKPLAEVDDEIVSTDAASTGSIDAARRRRDAVGAVSAHAAASLVKQRHGREARDLTILHASHRRRPTPGRSSPPGDRGLHCTVPLPPQAEHGVRQAHPNRQKT